MILHSRRDRYLLSATLALLCGPVILDLLTNWKETPLRYLAADAFYYLVVARNWANVGAFTFDQTHPTNGFHPLWQTLTAMVYKLGHVIGLDDHSCLIMVFLLSVALVCLGVALIAVAIAKRCGRIPIPPTPI